MVALGKIEPSTRRGWSQLPAWARQRVARWSWRHRDRPVGGALMGMVRGLDAFDELKRVNEQVMFKHMRKRDAKLQSFPKTLQVEHTTVCNLRCRMCSIVRPSRRREPAHLAVEDLDRLRPILPYVRTVKLNGGGEPFLVPDIERSLEVFHHYRVRINTTTNATLITERLARLIGRSFSELIVSLDGVTAETYEMVRVNARFDQVVRGIERVNAVRRPDLKLKIGFVAMRCNMHELPALVRFAKQHRFDEVLVSWMVPFQDLPWTHDQDPTLDPVFANRWLAEARAAAEAEQVKLLAPNDLPITPRPEPPCAQAI